MSIRDGGMLVFLMGRWWVGFQVFRRRFKAVSTLVQLAYLLTLTGFWHR